jgi:DNA-binding IclR family transcriptional regulator
VVTGQETLFTGDLEPRRAAILRAIERMPSTVFGIAARTGLDVSYVRRVLAALEHEGKIAACDPNGAWGRGWWRVPGMPEPEVPQ